MSGLNPPSGLSTPSRDKDRHPFPQPSHSSPAPSLRQTSNSSAAASFTHLPSTSTSSSSSSPSSVQVSPTPLTVEALLKQHATASDPRAAALDQAITERNLLSAQNTQLWKLIEKQRAGYNQILKELERIRGERDSYKSKLSALSVVANGSSSRQQKSSTERTSRPSLDTATSQVASASQSRQVNTRHNSDDTSAAPRSSHHHHHPSLHSSRSFDGRSSENGFQSNAAHLTTPIRTASPPPPPPASAPAPSTRQVRPSPSPLVVPPRGENLTLASSALSNSPESFAFSKQPPTGELNTTPNNSAPSGIYPSSASARPMTHPRKSSLADSFSSIVTSASSVVSTSSPATSASTHSLGLNATPTPLQQTYHTGHTPQTAPSGFNASPSPDPRQRTPGSAAPLNNSQLPPPTIAAPTNTTPSPLAQRQALPPQSNMLSAVVDSRSHMLSRDSRISLPDEARQYIANMADSPVASPRADHFSPRSKLSNSVFPLTANGNSGESGRESEFLDMGDGDESDEESDAEGVGDITAGAGDSAFESVRSVNTQGAAGQTHHGPTTQPAHHPLHLEQLSNYSSHSNSSREDLDSIQSKRKDKSRVAAEEFPLPPPSNPYVQQRQQQQPQAMASMDGHPPSTQQSSLYVQQSTSVVAPSPSIHTPAMADQYPHSSLSSSGNQQQHHHQRTSSRDIHAPMQQQQQLESPYSAPPPPPYQYQPDPRAQQQPSQSPQDRSQMTVQAGAFRALPLLSSDLPHTNITVSHSFVRPNDRGKEVLSFIVFVKPGNGKEGWNVEKMYSDVLNLDQRVRSSVGRGVGKKIANLPEGKLWKDHAPAKVDQRKAVLEHYLQTLIHLPVKNNDEVIAFFTTDIVREQKQPVMQVGHKEGYLTKRGKNFGGWKTRFFVLQGPVLEYYDCRGGAHLGSISITGAQIARQHRTEKPPSTDDEKEYRHAFLIVEAKKGPGGNHPRHVLCAESDEDRDSWVEMLVRYYTGTYSEDLVFNPSSGLTSLQSNSIVATSQQPLPVSANNMSMGQPRSSTSSSDMSISTPVPMIASSTPRSKPPARGLLREEIARGHALPIPQLPPDANNAKLFQAVPTSEDYARSGSPSRSVDASPIDRQGPSPANYGFEPQKRLMERSALGLPSSLPDSSSPLSGGQPFQPDGASSVLGGQRANSELGHYSDLQPSRGPPPAQPLRQHSPEQHRPREREDGRKPFHPTLNTVAPSPTTITSVSAGGTPPPDRVPSPEKLDASGKVKISGPMNGAPIPSGFKFGGKDAPSADSTSASASNDRRERAKSRSFWGFGKGDKGQPLTTFTPRAVFGVPLEEALDVAQVCSLPAIVFRSIQYLQAKKADQEEGIYRLSGSSAVIKSLKDRFNNEGDVDLLASDEYWDPHAIAGLLKSFLRELPSSILTRELHLRFLAVIDFVDPQERIKELSQLIAALPLANYSLLRALTAHLILIVQNSNVNKMTMRNVGIVFSPTLGIPAGVFSLMLGEFNRVFDVDADNDEPRPKESDGLLEHPSEALRRNSRQYLDAAADQVLGLSGRTLSTSAEETQSDGDDFSIQDESGTETTEGDATVESSSSSPASAMMQRDHRIQINVPDSTPNTPTAKNTSKAANVAASRGLNVAVTKSERGNRHSRMMGLPLSPRPSSHSPSRGEVPSNTSPVLARSE